ncbi:MAG: exodeoxyribonuclease VII small subunit [Planctomycetota bacterium]|nr:exodeoxyribonuclease VII small subunit [Planctomycetota bacterium]
MAQKKIKFEEAMSKLEKIVASIEQGKVGLEESIKQFEEGMGLIQQCRGVLNDAELKIQKLQSAGADGVSVRDAKEPTGP